MFYYKNKKLNSFLKKKLKKGLTLIRLKRSFFNLYSFNGLKSIVKKIIHGAYEKKKGGKKEGKMHGTFLTMLFAFAFSVIF